MIRLLIVDDQDLVRSGFRMILDAQPDFEVVAEAADGAAALAEAKRYAPDVVLMDIRMPIVDGITATRDLLAEPSLSHTRVLILTTFDHDEYVYEGLRAGASGFLLKNAATHDLIAAVRTVHAGEALLAPSVTRRLIEQFVARPRLAGSERLSVLTARERDVLVLIARGRSNAEIAEALVVSGATVRTHVNRVLSKLSLRDRTQAAIMAYESGLVVAGET